MMMTKIAHFNLFFKQYLQQFYLHTSNIYYFGHLMVTLSYTTNAIPPAVLKDGQLKSLGQCLGQEDFTNILLSFIVYLLSFILQNNYAFVFFQMIKRRKTKNEPLIILPLPLLIFVFLPVKRYSYYNFGGIIHYKSYLHLTCTT